MIEDLNTFSFSIKNTTYETYTNSVFYLESDSFLLKDNYVWFIIFLAYSEDICTNHRPHSDKKLLQAAANSSGI